MTSPTLISMRYRGFCFFFFNFIISDANTENLWAVIIAFSLFLINCWDISIQRILFLIYFFVSLIVGRFTEINIIKYFLDI